MNKSTVDVIFQGDDNECPKGTTLDSKFLWKHVHSIHRKLKY